MVVAHLNLWFVVNWRHYLFCTKSQLIWNALMPYRRFIFTGHDLCNSTHSTFVQPFLFSNFRMHPTQNKKTHISILSVAICVFTKPSSCHIIKKKCRSITPRIHTKYVLFTPSTQFAVSVRVHEFTYGWRRLFWFKSIFPYRKFYAITGRYTAFASHAFCGRNGEYRRFETHDLAALSGKPKLNGKGNSIETNSGLHQLAKPL